MNPPSITEPTPKSEPILDVAPVLAGSVRGALLGIALALLGVFTLAALINPYAPDGTARTMGTHTQLGLTDCGFYLVTGVPCPSCGMTTSFALLVRGDVVNSLRANFAGTLLAGLCLLAIPWCLIGAWCGRTPFIRSLEWTFLVLVVVFAALTLVRWLLVVALTLYTGGGAGS